MSHVASYVENQLSVKNCRENCPIVMQWWVFSLSIVQIPTFAQDGPAGRIFFLDKVSTWTFF